MCKYLGILMRNIHQCVKSPFPKDGTMGSFVSLITILIYFKSAMIIRKTILINYLTKSYSLNSPVESIYFLQNSFRMIHDTSNLEIPEYLLNAK